MEQQYQQHSQTPIWKILILVVPSVAILTSGLTALFTGGMEYGKLQSSLEVEQDRYNKVLEQLSHYQEANTKWSEAYAIKEQALAEANARIAQILNDHCQRIQNDISSIANDLSYAERLGYSPERRLELQNQYSENQQSLRSCLGARR